VAAVFKDEAMVYYYSRRMKDPGADAWAWMEKMVQAGPAGTRWVIAECKSGSHDGEVEQITAAMFKEAPYDVHPYVSALFEDPDPRARGYAASVAGYLGDPRYRKAIEKLTGDSAELPQGWSDRTVSQRAKRALPKLLTTD